jgi:hypothetical protein
MFLRFFSVKTEPMLSPGYWPKKLISDGASEFIIGNTGQFHEVSEQTNLQGYTLP